jgi:predicted DsbA family dithiol-disulfide isomerase
MRVEIWSDVVCPWCYIGKRRFEAALAGFPHRDEVEVVWRSFELDPSAPRERPGDRLEYLAAKYGTTRAEAEAMEARVTAAAAGEGLDLRLDLARSGNSLDAHRLLHLAAEHGLQDALKERFLRAYFTEGEPIGDSASLERLAVDAGLPAADVADVLRSDRYREAVQADERQARAYGANGVPFFVFDSTYGVSGAQAPEVFANVLERAWSEAEGSIDLGAGSGEDAACDDGACAVPDSTAV